MRAGADGRLKTAGGAIELFGVCEVITVARVMSFMRVSHSGRPVPLASTLRTAGSISCYALEMKGLLCCSWAR